MDAKLNFSLLEGNLNDSFISDVGRRSPPTRQFPPSLVMPTILGKIDEEANLPRIHLYSSSTEKADSSPTPSNPTKSNAAPTMQGNEDFAVMGLKQREKLMEGLRKENFELKLKAYFLEDTLEKTTPEWYEKAVHEITSLREQNTLYLSEITKIQSDYEKRWRLLEIEVADKHSKELHEWERKLNEAEDHIARMEEENDALSETVKVKSAEVHEALEQLDLHKMRVREKELKLEEVDRLNRELEAQRDEARFSADENVDQARQLRSECEGLRSELKKAKEEREKARADSARWKDRAREEKKNGSTEISKLQNEIEHVKSSIRATEQDRDSLKKRLADLERKLADSERYRTDLELEKEDLVREAERSNERLVKSTRRHEQEMARLQQRNGRLQDELNRAQRGMLSKNAAVSTEIDALRIDVAAKESDINELNSSLQFLHSVLERIANIFRTSSAVADFRLVVPADHQTSERMRNVRAVEGCLGDLLVACSSGEVPVSIQHNLATMLSLLARSVMRTTSASNPGSPILSIRSTPKPGNQFHETASAAESSPGPLDPGRNADLNEHSRSRSQKPRSSMGAGGLGGVVMDETQRHKIKNGSGEAGDHSARAECKSENISHETALLRQKLDLSQLKLQKKSIECQELEDKLLDQTKEMVSLKEQQENLRVENQSLSASKESLIRANEQKCLRKDEKITSMKTELESKVKEIDSLKAEISGLQSQLSKLNSRISQLKPEAESLRLANAKHAAERAQLLDSQRRDVDNMATFLRSKVEEVELLLAREREQTSYLRRELEVRCKLMAELEGQLVDEQEGRVQDREDAQIARARFEAEAHKFIMDAEEKRRHVEETAEERVERAMDEAKSLIQEAETSAKMRIQEANESLRAIKEEMGIQKLALEQAIKDKEEVNT
ncbi:hypothetical protein BJ742DRAFT_365234 [Cladochytrium replicatum]|nr:hypothetical protein BJ742DRAFT_365234 [Cladochytrium replicatum]